LHTFPVVAELGEQGGEYAGYRVVFQGVLDITKSKSSGKEKEWVWMKHAPHTPQVARCPHDVCNN